MDNPISSINVKVYKGIVKGRHNKGVCLFKGTKNKKKKKKKGKYEVPHSLAQALTLTVTLSPNHYTRSNFGRPCTQFHLVHTIIHEYTYFGHLWIVHGSIGHLWRQERDHARHTAQTFSKRQAPSQWKSTGERRAEIPEERETRNGSSAEGGDEDVISTQECHTYIIYSYLSFPCPRETGSNDTERSRTPCNKKAPDLSKPLLPTHTGYYSITLYIWILSSPCTLNVQHLVPELHNP